MSNEPGPSSVHACVCLVVETLKAQHYDRPEDYGKVEVDEETVRVVYYAIHKPGSDKHLGLYFVCIEVDRATGEIRRP